VRREYVLVGPASSELARGPDAIVIAETDVNERRRDGAKQQDAKADIYRRTARSFIAQSAVFRSPILLDRHTSKQPPDELPKPRA
jgi:hypothetical protein